MRTSFLTFILLTVLCVSTTIAWGNDMLEQYRYDIPALTGITIDGKADDWGTRGFRVELMATEKGLVPQSDEFAPTFRLGWSPEGLLLLVQVRDAHIRESSDEEHLWWASSFEVYISSKRGSKERYQVDFSTGADPKYPKLRWHVYDLRTTQTPELTVQAAAGSYAGGYQVEALFPWKNLSLTPQEGDELAVQLYAIHVPVNGIHHHRHVVSPSGRRVDAGKPLSRASGRPPFAPGTPGGVRAVYPGPGLHAVDFCHP